MIIEQINQNLLIANSLDSNFLRSQTKKLLEKRVDFCDFYLQCTTTESWALDEGIIKSGSFAINQGVGIRAICGEKTFLSYSNSISPKTIQSLVNNLFIEPVTSLASSPKVQSPASLSLYTSYNPILATSSEQKTKLLHTINQLARSKDYVINVMANLSLEYDEICIARSDDRLVSDIRPLVHLSISLIINKHGQIEKGSSGLGGRYELHHYTDEILAWHIDKAYQQAVLKTEAISGPSGQMPVVLGNGWAGVILHEAVGHGLEGDFNRKGSSAFSNKIGHQVASPNVTIIDENCIEQ
ncbi:MAG: metallopeptidase TldD-related protein, partial [Burkholderiales bacterium]